MFLFFGGVGWLFFLGVCAFSDFWFFCIHYFLKIV